MSLKCFIKTKIYLLETLEVKNVSIVLRRNKY